MPAVALVVALMAAGCSGINASKSVSPLDFLLPGLHVRHAVPSSLGPVAAKLATDDSGTVALASLREIAEPMSPILLPYTTPKQRIQLGCYTRTVVDGANSDGKFWLGGYLNFPLGHTKPSNPK